MLKVFSHLANKFITREAKQHEREVVVDAVYSAVGEEGDHTTDVSKHPHHTQVDINILVIIYKHNV